MAGASQGSNLAGVVYQEQVWRCPHHQSLCNNSCPLSTRVGIFVLGLIYNIMLTLPLGPVSYFGTENRQIILFLEIIWSFIFTIACQLMGEIMISDFNQ